VSVSNWGVDVTIVAGADVSGKQYQPLGLTGILSTTDADVFGVLQNKPQAAEHGTVRKLGYTKLYMPVSMGAGALVMGSSTTSGHAALCTSGSLAFAEIVFSAVSGSYATAWLYGGPVRRAIA
jgi:hypothetical protein